MIPLRLSVRNFMCYRDNVPTLDFEGLHVACLCGDNGHGKSALLDAITWALWGSTRASQQHELIHQGQTDMEVTLDILVRDQVYRVIRKHTRRAGSRQGATVLEFQTSTGDGFRPITANSVRETEALIVRIIQLDHDTFINTAYLQQGKADQFTQNTASRRKEFLAEALGLSYYERLEERAKARVAELRDSIRDAEERIASRQLEIDRKPEHEGRLESALAGIAALVPERDERRAEYEALQRTATELSLKRRDLPDIENRLAYARSEAERLERETQELQARLDSDEAIAARADEIEASYATLIEARTELEKLNAAQTSLNVLRIQESDLNRRIDSQRLELEYRRNQLDDDVRRLRAVADRISQIEEHLRLNDIAQQRLAQSALELQTLRGGERDDVLRVQSLAQDNKRLRDEMEDTRRKFDLLERGETLCPLCNQEVGENGAQHLRAEYEAQGRAARQLYRSNGAEKRELDRKLKRLAVQIAEMEREQDVERRRIQGADATLKRERDEAERAREQLETVAPQLERLRARLESCDYALEERASLAEVAAGIEALGYDDADHQAQRIKVSAFESYEELDRQMREAQGRLESERASLDERQKTLARRAAEADDYEARVSATREELSALPEVEAKLGESERRLRELESRIQECEVQRGIQQDRIAHCEALEKLTREDESARRGLVDEKGIYDELAIAFGKNGIPALIIENAIPELQGDANRLLSRLTENRMSLKLELKEGRRLRGSDVRAEELDILIADEIGTRSYEMFSGGEAFRIDFALRIALSRLLASRSGAPLPILFIDEGFGSQDASGQERLTEAIKSIEDDFQKIIVITHVEQMKEAFPVRIEVTKDEYGSTFSIV